jgi:Predicted glycosyltransferases
VIQSFLEEKKLQFMFVNMLDEHIDIHPGPGEVILVWSGKNGGYSYGNNLGLRLAKSLALFSYLLIINNDIVLKDNFLEEMVNCYEDLRIRCKTEKIALGATELGEDGIIHHKGFHYIHLLTGITFSSPYFPSFKYIVGSCIFTDIGAPLMDESFFLYFDDTQYSKILHRNGYLLESSSRSLFIHEAGGTGKKNIQGMIFKSLIRFYRLNYPILLPVVVPVRIILIAYLCMKGKLVR